MNFRERLLQNQVVVAPGVYDPLTASLATEAGFEALYLSGAAIAYTRLGRPDIGLVSMSEVADTIALVRDRVPTPLVVDADNGYGNALNVQRTVRIFERAGATAIQLEDQSFPEALRPSRTDKSLIPAAEMARQDQGRGRCARAREETLIIARTDAVAVEGFEPRHRARAALSPRRAPTCCSSRRRRRREQLAAVTSALGALRAAAGQHGRGRQRRPLSAAQDLGAHRLPAGDLSRAASCARWPAPRRIITRSLAHARHQRAVPRPHVRFRRRSTASSARPRCWRSASATSPLTRRLPMSAIDPVTLAVLKGRLEQIADEMDATLYRSAFNPIIAEAHDACHGLYHAVTGATLVQGTNGLPIFVGAMAFAVKAVIDKVERDGGLEPGDTFLFNDPYDGGTHLNDFRLVRPIFRDGKLFAGSPRSGTGSTSAATCRAASTRRRPKASRRAFAFRP